MIRRRPGLKCPISTLRELLGSFVVSRDSVDSGLDENQPVLGVFVFLALLEMLADAGGLANQTVGI